MTQPETTVDAMSWLKSREPSVCGYAKALTEVPDHIREALEAVRNDRDVSTPRIRELLGQYVSKIPSETSIRNHRNARGCATCDKENLND